MPSDSIRYCTAMDEPMDLSPDSSPLSSTFASMNLSGYGQDTPFFDCVGMSPSPSPSVSSNWSQELEHHPAMLPPRLPDSLEPVYFTSDYPRDLVLSGYSEPRFPMTQFRDVATAFSVHEDVKDGQWMDDHCQVFSLGGISPKAVETPQPAFEQRTMNPTLETNPETMRQKWIDMYSRRSFEDSEVRKVFSKPPKRKVATANTLKASALRRKHEARFSCHIEGCGDRFTRKHNLDNHLRSHCGVTDLLCPKCDKGFTTIPVLKRHQKSCSRLASRLAAQRSNSYMAMLSSVE